MYYGARFFKCGCIAKYLVIEFELTNEFGRVDYCRKINGYVMTHEDLCLIFLAGFPFVHQNNINPS